MRYIHRRPEINVSILRPQYLTGGIPQEIAYFSPGQPSGPTESDGLLGYHFTESLESIETGFSLTVTPETDRWGLSWMDKILPRDLVVIREFGLVRFVGIVGELRYSAQMDDTPNRSISISGSNVGGLLRSFKLVLDQSIYQYSSTISARNQAFVAALEQEIVEGAPIRTALIRILEEFLSMMSEVGNVPLSAGVLNLLLQYIDYETGISADVKSLYPIQLSFYERGANDLWSIWEGIVQRPLQELYGRWVPGQDKFGLFFREAPFDAASWAALRYHVIDPIVVRSVEIGRSDKDVYTFFASLLNGGPITREVALATGQFSTSSSRDTNRWALYGYRPLEMSFKYFDRRYLKDFTGASSLMAKMNAKVMDWYELNAEFMNGTIEIMNTADWYPLIGEKIRYLGGEFYVEATTRRWQYGGPTTTALSVTRGYRYAEDGSYAGPITRIGQAIKRSEATA